MTTGLVTAAHYLSYSEAVALYQALQQQDITALVKTYGPPRFSYMQGAYFSLHINAEDQTAAQPTLDQFSEKQALMANKTLACRACGSEEVVPDTQLPWYKKLYYKGTSVYKCQACQFSYFR